MEITQSLTIMKALADQSRLRIIHALMEKPQYLEELSKRLNLAGSTMSFHLKKLENAGLILRKKEQYYAIFSLNRQLFNSTLWEILKFADNDEEAQLKRLHRYHREVQKEFISGAKLVKLPTQTQKRRIVLKKLADLLAENQWYSREEVEMFFANRYDSPAELVDQMLEENLLVMENMKIKKIISESEPTTGTKEPAREDDIFFF